MRKKMCIAKSSVAANQAFHQESFCKIILPGTITSGVKIPTSLLKDVGKDPSGNATLIIAGRGQWPVQLLKDGDEMVFGEGWESFCKDNYLHVTNVLIFKHQSNLVFDVDIFDDRCVKLR